MAIDSSSASPRRRALWEVVAYGACCGVLLTVLRLLDVPLFAGESPGQPYGLPVALVFAAVGIGVGWRLTRRPPVTIVREIQVEVPLPAPSPPAGTALPFVHDASRQRALGITPRELEILCLIAEGLSNREIAARLFVSENTVKTHSGRLFDKLGAKRRTQAVQIAKASQLIP